jgi:hypothetical protein
MIVTSVGGSHSANVSSIEKATLGTSTSASWSKTGFDCERRDAATYLAINESKIRQSQEFREIRESDYQSTRLTERKPSQKSQCINKHVFKKGNEE